MTDRKISRPGALVERPQTPLAAQPGETVCEGCIHGPACRVIPCSDCGKSWHLLGMIDNPFVCPRCPEDFLLAARRTVQLSAAAAVVDLPAPAAPASDRVVSGTVLPYGPVGHTSVGPVIVPGPGRIRLPEDLSRIKLVDYHQDPPVAVGYATAMRDTPTGLRASFLIADTEDGDRILSAIRQRVRDGFSVELVDLQLTPASGADELVAAELSAVASVPIPAWADAREDGLAAAHHHTPEGTTMTKAQRKRLAQLLGMDSHTEEQATELAQLLALAAAEHPTDEEGSEEEGSEEDSSQEEGSEEDGSEEEEQPTGRRLAASRRVQAPSSLGGRRRGTGRRSGRDLDELFAATARVLSGRSRPQLEAALSDITSTANIWTSRDDYAGQLWSGLTYVRRFVPLMTPGRLTSYKGTGWRWVTKPAVADYAGDKAAVPSNAPTTEEVSWNAARLAGAHDLDRKFADFGDTEFIAAYYEALRESYAEQSDTKARLFLLAQGAANIVDTSSTDLFHAAAHAAAAVEDGTNGQQADYFLINSADRFALLDITDSQIPAYLETFGVTPDKFISTPGQTAGRVTAGIKQASMFRELTDTPIRVEAINLANGGIDGGVFGYYATQQLHDAGIASASFV